jgi:ActR/RegA family two-component response regulator
MRDDPALCGKRILVVEDEYFIADDLKRALSRAGAQVAGPVGSLGAALSIARDATLDAAILDVNLAGEMSFPIADELLRQGVPFLLATGYEEWVIPPRFDSVPRSSKPFSVQAVVDQLSLLASEDPSA